MARGRFAGIVAFRRWAGTTAVASLLVLVVGGIPGARLRSGPAPRRVVVDSTVREEGGLVQVGVRGLEAGAPIAGARVQAWAVSSRRVAERKGEGETDGSGRVRLGGLPRGEIWIVADALDRSRASTHLVLEADARSVELELGPAHRLEIRLKDEQGAPVSDAEVEAVSGSDPLPLGARSRDDGVARVDRLGRGPWQVAVRAAGYEETSARAERDDEPLTITLRKLSAIRVHVTAGGGDAPASGARVFVAGPMLWPARETEADADGNVRMGGLSPGSYALRATKGSEATPIELGVVLERSEEKAVELRLAPGRFVAVRVTEGDADDAEPIAGARVSLAEAGVSPFPLEATTDVHGRARLGPIAPGPATASARADGFVAGTAVAVDSPTSGAPPSETRLSLVRGGVLTGRVVDARGMPVDGATLEIAGTDWRGGPIFDDPRRLRFRAAHFAATLGGPAPLVAAGELGVLPGPVPPIPHGGPVAFMVPNSIAPFVPAVGPGASVPEPAASPWVTRSDGTFRIAPASPGRIRAIVHHPQYVETQSEVVTLAPGGQARVDIVLREGGALEGRVLDAHDRPVSGARVFVAATRGSLERTTRTASDGTFAFGSLPDDVSLAVAPADEETPEIRMAVTIPEGGRNDVVVRLPEAREPLPVAVVDERGWPVNAAQVTVTSLSKDSLLRATVFTDDRGEAHVPRGRGLALRVEVRAPSHAPHVVTTSGGEQGLRIELRPAESVTGEVVAARGLEPIAGADVTFYGEAGARHARADARGAFSLREISAGPARIIVRAPGHSPLREALDVPDSEGRRPFSLRRIELADEGVAEGDVVDSLGAPVPGARVAVDHVPTWVLVGVTPQGMALADSRGHFRLGELEEGSLFLEAYAPSLGRGRVPITITAGATVERLRIALSGPAGADQGTDPSGTGSVAITLGETSAPTQVTVVSVLEGSEAERSGLAPGDVIASIDGAAASSMADARSRLSGPVEDDVLLKVVRGPQTLALRVAREPVRR